MTIRMINKLLPDTLGISVSYPLPGTVFYEKVKADLSGGKTNWTDSDELQIMFRNTYPPAFYKELHRYVHKTYRWHLGWQQIKKMVTRPAAMTKAGLHRAASIAWYLPAAFFAKMRLKKYERPLSTFKT